MDGVRVGYLGPSHSITPAAVIENKNKTDPLKTVNMLMRKGMGHHTVQATQASSVDLQIWQYGAKDNIYNFASFNRVVDTKTSVIQIGPNISNVG